MRKLIGLITAAAGLPGLAGIYLLYKLGNLPAGAVIVVLNAALFKGICGTAGGILIWRGRRWGYYLTAVTWIYLVVVSMLTLIRLYHDGIVLDIDFLSENFSSYGKALLWSAGKIILGMPILYWIGKELSSRRV